MEEDESFDEFYAKLKDIVNLNFAFNLGETILEPKIVRKVLRSLPRLATLQDQMNILSAKFDSFTTQW